MSEYLKWYDSYLDHTPTEDLAKNELESAHRKIKHATEQLAKAKERVEELEKNSLRQCIFMEKTAEKLEHHREWQATANVLRRPTRESKEALNKFAVHQKIEALKKFENISNAVANHWCAKEQKGYLWLHSELMAELKRLEQLRKEQE